MDNGFMNLRITSIDKAISVETSEKYLDVAFDIINPAEDEGGEPTVLTSRRLALPYDLDTDGVRAELAKYLEAYKGEVKQAKKQAKLDKLDENADTVIKELKGTQL
jgi:hypothetical protein